jgi:hypothetical protein
MAIRTPHAITRVPHGRYVIMVAMRPRLQAFFQPLRLVESLVVAGASILELLYSYLLNPGRPAGTSIGYYGAFDQSQYLRIAEILASGRLPVGPQYTYGLGFPLLGVPAIWLGDRKDPFIVPDIVLISASLVAIYGVACRMATRRIAVVVVALLLVASPLLPLTVMPWSSTVSVFCLAAALFVATAPGPAGPGRFVLLGIVTGWAFSARFVDVIPVAAVAIVAVSQGDGRRLIRTVAAAIPAALLAFGVALTQWYGLGSPLTTPYSLHVRPGGTTDQDAGQYQLLDIPRHFFETFVRGTDHGVRVNASPLLEISPYLVLVPIGAIVLIRAGRWRALHIVTLAITVTTSLIYLSFVAGGGSDLIYSNPRYWISFYPYWTLLAVIGCASGLRWIWNRGSHPVDLADPSNENPSPESSSAATAPVRQPRGR